MSVLGKFCPVCGESRPVLLTKLLHLAKNQRYRCEGCSHQFTIHVEVGEADPVALYHGKQMSHPQVPGPDCPTCSHETEFCIRNGAWLPYCEGCERFV